MGKIKVNCNHCGQSIKVENSIMVDGKNYCFKKQAINKDTDEKMIVDCSKYMWRKE